MLRNVDELVWRPATELAALIRSKQISPVELTEAVLARIDALNPRLNAFCLVAHDLARRGAREAEIAVTKAEPLGALHGVPLSIKDVIFTRGLRTTGGSRLFAEAVPDDDAVVVGRVRAAGAVILGKTTTAEFGHKAVTESPLFGITRNPWNLELSPGGSSGGAAVAVASGLGPVSRGSDAGGSVRIPASFCGVYGFKPSRGRVPDTLGFPGYEHVNCPGPLTRSVRDAALVLDVIAGGDDRDRFSLPRESRQYVEACDEAIKGLHVAWAPDLGFATVDPGVQAICENAARSEEHTSELQSLRHLVCRLLLEKKKKQDKSMLQRTNQKLHRVRLRRPPEDRARPRPQAARRIHGPRGRWNCRRVLRRAAAVQVT